MLSVYNMCRPSPRVVTIRIVNATGLCRHGISSLEISGVESGCVPKCLKPLIEIYRSSSKHICFAPRRQRGEGGGWAQYGLSITACAFLVATLYWPRGGV